jgi:hypothetical protein
LEIEEHQMPSAGSTPTKAQEKALAFRAAYWPEVAEDALWHRKRCDGYTTMPRTMPILMSIIDALSKNRPAGRVYLGLWARTFDEALLVIENPASLAAESDFSGERAVSTWRQRMRTLKELGFIDAKHGSSGEFHYVLIFNPHRVVWKLKDQIQEGLFRQLWERAIDIGARDMKPPPSPEPEASPKKMKKRLSSGRSGK